ncbi:MAG TPA: acetyl-CoA carboxylase biotin carboxyl carrier protein subunit, partial [Moraxellaceae bacterium]
AFKARQKTAFDAEVELWKSEDSLNVVELIEEEIAITVAEGGHLVAADISGNVWKLLVEAGSRIEAGEPLVILEAMKMEFPIHAPVSGTVRALHCRPGKAISAGDALLEIELA